MTFLPSDIELEPVPLKAELPPAVLDIEDVSIKAESPIGADLVATRADDGQIVVRGKVYTTLQLECGRCLRFLEHHVQVDDFEAIFPAESSAPIDLTPLLREDILLRLPLNPACRLDSEDRCPFTGKQYGEKKLPPLVEGGAVWQALDNLNIDKE